MFSGHLLRDLTGTCCNYPPEVPPRIQANCSREQSQEDRKTALAPPPRTPSFFGKEGTKEYACTYTHAVHSPVKHRNDSIITGRVIHQREGGVRCCEVAVAVALTSNSLRGRGSS